MSTPQQSARTTRRGVVPNNRERRFEIEELFFSTTDTKGHISACNDVFVRVSGYEREQLLGSAHNIVRHPDMPRSVFRIFWEMLQAGEWVAAYVKNLATDGTYYWVMALATACDDQFLSVRIKPSSEIFEAAVKIYKQVAAVEREVEAGDPKRRGEAIDAGTARLNELLVQAGYTDYRSFMSAALPAEVSARKRAVGNPPIAAAAGTDTVARLRGAQQVLGHLVENLSDYDVLADELLRASRLVIALADEIRLFAVNAVLVASRLGSDGAALSAVAEVFGRQSDAAGPEIAVLRTELDSTVTNLDAVRFRIAAAEVQAEMITELIQSGSEVLDVFAPTLVASAESLASAVTALSSGLDRVGAGAHDVEARLGVVRALEINGRVEGARVADAQIAQLFAEIGTQVGSALSLLRAFRQTRERASAGGQSELATELCGAVATAADSVRELARAA